MRDGVSATVVIREGVALRRVSLTSIDEETVKDW